MQEFETIAEACAALKVSRSKLYNLIGTGQLKAVKVGSATRILVADRVEFMRSLPAMPSYRTRVALPDTAA